jgi:hypothetical protein
MFASLGLSTAAAAQPAATAHPSSASQGSNAASPAKPSDHGDRAKQAQKPEATTDASLPASRSSSWWSPLLSQINQTGEGWTARAGRIASGGGLALGQAYTKSIFEGRAVTRAEMLFSVKGYLQGELSLSSRPLGAGGLTVGGRLRYTDLAQEDFFGFGQASSSSMHTSYSDRMTDVSLVTTLAPRSWLHIEGTAGFVNHDIGRGRQSGVPSIEERFTAQAVPGLDASAQFMQAGVAAVVDLRDVAEAPRRGGWYRASLTHYEGIRGNGASFGAFEADLRQFIAIPGTSKHVLALRGQVASTVGGGDAEIPFFMMPRLGGGSSLRGYEIARYTDRHLLAFSVEHRWDVLPKLQLVGFVDAGQVAPTFGGFGLERFQSSVGMGLRYRVGGHTAIRLDVAAGSEGPRWHIGFGPSF